jgi:acetyl esterase/lipase
MVPSDIRTIELAAHHNAILVCPDYRLLPESSGLDIISDLHHFYTWLHTHLADFLCQHFPLQPPVPDLGRILITGESAGGYMAVQSVLLGEVKGVKAVIAHYPMLDMQNHWYSKPGRKEICGQLPPDYPAGWLDRQLNLAKESKPVTHRIPKEGELDTFVALLQEGRYTQVLGSDATLFPIQNLERMKSEGGKLLPMWIFHGDQDTIIPIDGMWAFKQRAVDVFGQEESGTIVTTVAKGQEHGFDNDEISLETNWVVEGRKWLSSHWP